MEKVVAFLSQLVQVKISFIGFNNNAQITLGKAVANYKLLEVSVALLTLGIRVTVRV